MVAHVTAPMEAKSKDQPPNGEDTCEMEILRPCFVSDASVKYLPTRADGNTKRKLDKGKTYTLDRADAKMLHKLGVGRLPWKDDQPQP